MLCAALTACGAAAPTGQAGPAGYDLPVLTGRVVDIADLLPGDVEAKLAERLAGVEAQSKHQFVVVTVRSLSGHSVEDYGVTLGRHWGIGRKGLDDGVLLLVAPNERKVRIEVGYGLEKALTDEEAGSIIRTDILPGFRAGRMAEGIVAGSESIIREITQ
ncbi:uncharacterized protein FHS95_003125 [Sphingomonas naasensis]|uniref:TPM domain-containing protein n=1 Tax=Sphingomonas naasensis TaxID=1344951 RepID=UPI001F0E55CC|nr:TPM domain-containing protein [Sphingomonas naasensis]NIJ21422.1 uncharacterized protein [Sphingomonas naasensis]